VPGHQIVPANVSDRPLALDANNVYFSSGTTGLSVVPKGGGAVTTLAAGDVADGIALDDTYVYYTNHFGGVVRRVPKAGGTPTTLGTVQSAAVDRPSGIAVDASYVYYTDERANSVYRVLKTGGTPQAIVTNEAMPSNLVVDASWVYFADYQSGVLRRIAPDGTGGPFTLGSVYAALIAQTGTDVVYINEYEAGNVPKGGGGAHKDYDFSPLRGIAVATFGDTVYYSTRDPGGPSDLASFALVGGTWSGGATYFESWTQTPTQIAVDDTTWVYVVANGVLERIAQ
jgi:hypothetical protein